MMSLDYTEIKELLIASGADLSIKNFQGETVEDIFANPNYRPPKANMMRGVLEFQRMTGIAKR